METLKIICNDIVSDQSIQNFIKDNTQDCWEGTPFARYRFMDNRAKGKFGEIIVKSILTKSGFSVDRPTNLGHDCIVNGIKTEIKFSLALTNNKTFSIRPNVFMLNHVSLSKDWERLIFLGINPTGHENILFWFTKDMITDLINTKQFFKSQQAGNAGGNDDYIVAGEDVFRLYNSPYVNKLEAWVQNG